MGLAAKLDELDATTLLPTEITQLRHELYQQALHHEAQAAAYWKAYWQTMGLTHRPLTAEQVALHETKKVKPTGTPRPKRPSYQSPPSWK